MGTSSASPSRPVPRPCTTVDQPCTQAPGGLWDTPRLRRLGRGAALRTGSSSPMSLGRSGLPDGPDDRSSKPSATYKDAPAAAADVERVSSARHVTTSFGRRYLALLAPAILTISQ